MLNLRDYFQIIKISRLKSKLVKVKEKKNLYPKKNIITPIIIETMVAARTGKKVKCGGQKYIKHPIKREAEEDRRWARERMKTIKIRAKLVSLYFQTYHLFH